MTLLYSAKLNGHDLCAYLKDVLTWLPTSKNSQIAELLPDCQALTAKNLLAAGVKVHAPVACESHAVLKYFALLFKTITTRTSPNYH